MHTSISKWGLRGFFRALGIILLGVIWVAGPAPPAFAGEFNITGDTNENWGPAVSGERIIWVECSGTYPDCDVYLYDLKTGIKKKISSGGRASTGPFGGNSISGNRIVWTDNRNTADANDIWMYALPTGPETRLTFHNSEQFNPDISGNIVVYASSAGTTADWGIYEYDISTSTETKIPNSDSGTRPAISGDLIVYEDYRHGDAEIYLYDRGTPVEKRITNHADDQRNPDISGKVIVWEDDRNGHWDIYMCVYNPSTGACAETSITTAAGDQVDPAISGDIVVWQDRGDYNIYIYDLSNPGAGVKQVSTGGFAERPAVFEDPSQTDLYRIVWEDGSTGSRNIFLYDPASDPPTAEMNYPQDGAPEVPLPKPPNPPTIDVVLHVKDRVSGVDESTVEIKVDGGVVIPNQPLPGGPLDYTLKYSVTNLDYEQKVTIDVKADDMAGNNMSDSFSFTTAKASGPIFDPTGDDDDDDIPNGVEVTWGFDPNMKTLFVRPVKKSGAGDDHWGDFATVLFPHPTKTYKAYIEPFANAGIEVVVIGASGHLYTKMNNWQYDPQTDTDPNKPPCCIMDVELNEKSFFPSTINHNMGHIWFDAGTAEYPIPRWRWDIKGRTTSSVNAFGYHTPELFPNCQENYFKEGTYLSIAVNETPVGADPCPINQCYEFNHLSPMNLNDDDAALPAHQEKGGDLKQMTVEFNPITFDASSKKITGVGLKSTKGYKWYEVLGRTTLHEMGHGLLGYANAVHCGDKNCIMCEYVHAESGWDWKEFGPGSCTHKHGGSLLDIRAKGIVHNVVSP